MDSFVITQRILKITRLLYGKYTKDLLISITKLLYPVLTSKVFDINLHQMLMKMSRVQIGIKLYYSWKSWSEI